jgi:hypothetical protein
MGRGKDGVECRCQCHGCSGIANCNRDLAVYGDPQNPIPPHFIAEDRIVLRERDALFSTTCVGPFFPPELLGIVPIVQILS